MFLVRCSRRGWCLVGAGSLFGGEGCAAVCVCTLDGGRRCTMANLTKISTLKRLPATTATHLSSLLTLNQHNEGLQQDDALWDDGMGLISFRGKKSCRRNRQAM